MKKVIQSENAPKPVGPYSQAIEAGNMLFCSGQIAIDPSTGTRNATSALFTLTNFVQDDDATTSEADKVSMKAVVTNAFEGGTWVTLAPYIFNDGTTTIPLDLPPNEMDTNHIATAARCLIFSWDSHIENIV